MNKTLAPILALSILLAPRALAADADDRANDEQRRQLAEQKRQQETYLQRLELLPGKRKIEDLLRVSNEGGKLTIKSPLFNDEQANQLRHKQVRAEVEGFEGFCTLMVQPIGKGSYYFTFSNLRYPNLEGVQNVTVSTQPGYLQISRNFNARGRNQSVSLVQAQGRSMYGQADGVQLNVHATDGTGRLATSMNVSESDFVALRRKYPREVNEHLRPLLRELKLENLFTVDATTAWQVFVDDWRGNAAVAGQVDALLPGLDLDSYRDREAAWQALKQLGAQGALVIYKMDRHGLTPEQNLRLDSAMGDHAFLSRAEAARMATDTDFLLDCLYSDDREVRAVAARHLKQVAHREVGLAPTDDYDTRVARVETLRGELAKIATSKPASKG